MNSAREWRTCILTRGVFGNALKFAHLQTTGEVSRTPMGAAGAISDRSVRNRIRFFLMIVKPFLRRDPDQPERELLRYMDPKSENQQILIVRLMVPKQEKRKWLPSQTVAFYNGSGCLGGAVVQHP